jgi:hypothetical protein
MKQCPRAKTPKRRSLGASMEGGGAVCERGTRLVEATTQPLLHRSNAPEGLTQFDLDSPPSSGFSCRLRGAFGLLSKLADWITRLNPR